MGFLQQYRPRRRYRSEADERRFALYAQGLVDRLIAEVEGVDRTTIGIWRRRQNLPPNDSPTIRFAYASPAKQALMRERIALMGRGWTDGTIGYHQHRDSKSIYNFRKRQGLPAATGTLDDQPRIVSYEACHGERYMADPSWSDWLEEMGATVW